MSEASITTPVPSIARGGCPRCGSLNPRDAGACRHCLAPLAPSVRSAQRRSSSQRLAGLALGVVLAVVLVGTATRGWGAQAVAGVRRLAGKSLPEPPAPTTRQITIPIRREGLAKFEPRSGCYLGAFVLHDRHVSGSMRIFEQRIGKGHASYLTYVGYGTPFPMKWVRQVRAAGGVPNIAFEPNDGLGKVQDDEYLRGFARAAAESGGPVFLRFASEMNGNWTNYHHNPQKYRYKFRLIHRVFAEEAPNVATVWTPYCVPKRNIDEYYPGDEHVDWVGVNLYSVHHHDGREDRPAFHEDPTELLRGVYDRYADRKPIQISEYAATHYCLACNQYVDDFAIEKARQLYRALPRRFPKVKMIYWFSWDTVAGKKAENNYAITDDPRIRDAYYDLISSDYFRPRFERKYHWTEETVPLAPGQSAPVVSPHSTP